MKTVVTLPHPAHGLWFYVDLQESHAASVGAGEPVNPDIGAFGVIGVDVHGPSFFIPESFPGFIEVSPPEYDAALWDNRVSPFLSDDGEALMFYCPDGPEAVVPVYVSDPDALLLDLFTNPG